MNVLLVNPPHNKIYEGMEDMPIKPMLPLGLAYLKAYINPLSNIAIDVLDLFLTSKITIGFELLKEKLANKRYDVVGVTVNTETYNNSLKVLRITKEQDQNTIVIFGGHHPTFLPEESLNDSADIIVLGEGELIFKEIIESILGGKNLENIKGIVFKKDNEIIFTEKNDSLYIKDLNNLLLPDRLSFSNYFPKYRNHFSIKTQRGCNGGCYFCGASGFYKGSVRYRSMPKIEEELNYIFEIANVRYIEFMDENLISDDLFFKDFCNLIDNFKYKFPWYCEARIDSLNEEKIKLMSNLGCKIIQIGCESANQNILNQINKNIKKEKIIETINLCEKYNIEIYVSFMMPFPDDTIETINETYGLIKKILKYKNCRIYVNLLTLFPGTKFYKEQEQFGLKIHTDNYDNYNFLTPTITTRNFPDLQKFSDIYSKIAFESTIKRLTEKINNGKYKYNTQYRNPRFIN